MQDFEAMHHLADLLESRAAKIPTPGREVYTRVVAQLRDAAELVRELARADD